jgi:cation diffusion facilitator family transporter
MGIHDLSSWRHDHAFDAGNRAGERRTWVVVAITALTMLGEIVAGILTGSMALLADGWHMATHVAALSIAGVSYMLARRWSGDERFAFGTWKIEVLGAFTSAVLLGVVALAMIWESLQRFLRPEDVQFGPALVVAVVGLAVNLASAGVLHGAQGGHGHRHDHQRHDHRNPGSGPGPDPGLGHDHHGHDHHGHDHHGHERKSHDDLNLASAYTHVLADALTSVLAIAALAAGLWLGWAWLDPAMGIVGAGVILWWSKGLVGDSARVLLDREMDAPIVEQVRGAVQTDGDAEIADLHVWRVGRASYAAVMTVVAHEPLAPDAYRARAAAVPGLVHVSVEVNRCPHGDCP